MRRRAAPDEGHDVASCRRHRERRDVFRLAADSVRTPWVRMMKRALCAARSSCACLLRACNARAQVDPFAASRRPAGAARDRRWQRRRAIWRTRRSSTGRFTHQKHLTEIPQPLTATGEFTYARGLGVYWHTLQPFDSVFVLTQQGIVQRDEGAETVRLSAQEQPAVRVIADIFLALVHARCHEPELDLRSVRQKPGRALDHRVAAEVRDDWQRVQAGDDHRREGCRAGRAHRRARRSHGDRSEGHSILRRRPGADVTALFRR